MADEIDPGDPFKPGSLRFEARKQLLKCVDALLDNVGSIGSPEWAELWAAVVEARQRWALYGRDGE